MARKKQPSAIGLAMLDLISNSLAAVIILFVIISSLRLPSIPPERAQGTLLIRFELSPISSDRIDASSTIWLEPPQPIGKAVNYGEIYWRSEMGIFNESLAKIARQDYNPERKKAKLFTPHVMVYSPEDSTNVHYVVIQDPVEGEWGAGLLYVDNEQLIRKEQLSIVHIEAWILGLEIRESIVVSKQLEAPTASFMLIIDVPKQL